MVALVQIYGFAIQIEGAGIGWFTIRGRLYGTGELFKWGLKKNG